MSVVTVNSRQARIQWRDLLDRVFTGQADIIIERSGKPVAVMIPVEDYEGLLDELDELRASRRAAEIYEDWKRNPRSARPIEDVEADFITKGKLDEHWRTTMESPDQA